MIFWSFPMHIPMSRDEIAQFLEILPAEVDHLWRKGRLQRTIACPYRDNPLLNWSSQYDVLEYALVSGDLPQKLSKEYAALWICNLAEADQDDDFESYGFDEQVQSLLLMALEDGLSSDVKTGVLIATIILVSRFGLKSLCQEP